MKTKPKDARLRELELLSELERARLHLDATKMDQGGRDMIAFLIHDGYLNGVGNQGWSYDDQFGSYDHSGGYNPLIRKIEYERWDSLNRLLGGQELMLSISHKGRVRLSELRQALKSGRDRDPSGILYDKRHVEQDLSIAILDATQPSPLAVAFLDMNGLKAINDGLGHPKGDEVIEVFLQTVSGVVQGRAEAYRNGGDEIVIIAPGMNAEAAKKMLVQIVVQLGKERVDGLAAPITASCGVVTTTNPGRDAEELFSEADKVMYRAKQESKKHEPRVSTVVVEDGPVETVAR
jgi:diguanylate cyclase (GGDEF)-like protein